MMPMANGQRSTANGQRSTANGQRSTANGQRPTVNGQWPMANGQRPMANGQRSTANGFSLERSFEINMVSRQTFQEIGHVLELGDVVLVVAAIFHQQREDIVVLFASVRRVQFPEVIENNAPTKMGGEKTFRSCVSVGRVDWPLSQTKVCLPCFDFFFCVLHPRNLLATMQRNGHSHSPHPTPLPPPFVLKRTQNSLFVIVGNVGEFRATFPVNRIREALRSEKNTHCQTQWARQRSAASMPTGWSDDNSEP